MAKKNDIVIEAVNKSNSLINVMDLTIPVLDGFVVQQNIKLNSKFTVV